MTWAVDAVLTGLAVPFGKNGERSAIAKSVIDEVVQIGFFGLEGDEQADLVHHGGRDKAIHHYPFDHYPYWRTEVEDSSILSGPGAFGENVSTIGLAEDGICIGDRFRLGTALVEVSQGRQPCWKLGHRLAERKAPAVVVRTGRSGWYYRVIEEGRLCAGDGLVLLDRPHPEWTVERVFSLLVRGEAKSSPMEAARLASLDALAENWRQRAASYAGR